MSFDIPNPTRSSTFRPHATVTGFKTAASFCDEYVPLSYAVEPIVRSGSLYTCTAKTGAGKTALLITTALAVATGRPDVLGREVTCGRVAYLACENPDDIRMRLMVSAFHFNIDLHELGDRLVVLDVRIKPEEALMKLRALSTMGDFTLIMVDTLAAFFDGNDINDAVQGGEFMRRLRPLTQLSGLPSVIVAAHPVKSAGDDNLVPYGSGAILNEVDGNLCLSKKDSGLVTLHWQGKLRGLEFKTVPFRLEIASSPDVVDVRGRQVLLPVMMPASEQSAEERADQETNVQLRILRILDTEEKPTLAVMESALGMDKNAIVRRLRKMQDGKLVEQILHRWVLTAKGRKALQ